MLHKDGTWVWVFSGGRVYLRDENQKAIRMAGIHLDITERRSMDARAIQYQKQNELIVDTVLNSVITLDQSYLVTGWNRQAALTLGYSAEETLGKSFWSLVFDLDLDDVAEIDGICGKLHESVAINKARERVPVEYSMTSLTVDDQSCFVVVLSDISSRRAQIHHQKLESIGLLATGIAHEINTPLQFISDNTSYLEQATQKLLSQINALNEQLESHRLQSIDQLRSWWTHEMAKNKFHKLENNIPEAICDSQEGIQRVIQIIRAMKDFSHPGTDARSELDVNRAIVSTVTLCRNRTKYVADVQLDLQPDLPFIECHPTEISQVILNLIVNATDAVAERLGPRSRGRIDIKSRSRDGGVEISISDNGIGMSPSTVERIFDPFFTTKAVGAGTGQGLTFCNNIVVNSHGGKIEATSIPNEGSAFEIWLPLARRVDSDTAADIPILNLDPLTSPPALIPA
jgi:PAS domain S-box-containing protein